MHSRMKATSNVNKLTHSPHWNLFLLIVWDLASFTEDWIMQIKLNHLLYFSICLSPSLYSHSSTQNYFEGKTVKPAAIGFPKNAHQTCAQIKSRDSFDMLVSCLFKLQMCRARVQFQWRNTQVALFCAIHWLLPEHEGHSSTDFPGCIFRSVWFSKQFVHSFKT